MDVNSPAAAASREVIIRDLEGRAQNVVLDQDRMTLGRSTANPLAFPDDVGLSRQHLALTRNDGQWLVEDLGSKNGTMLNGVRLTGAKPFLPGDRVTAGHLTIEFASAAHEPEKSVIFVEGGTDITQSSTTVVANLDAVLGPQGRLQAFSEPEDLNKTTVMQGNPQMWALIRAGRELAGHRPLAELFEVIMDLALEAVMAGRGLLMTVEGDDLKVRAMRGEGFEISKTVRDRVLQNKESLLVRDALLEQGLREHMSIVEQKVRSLIAVPLQTNDRVIGLIYLDSPNMIREFSREDLNLLTVMANVAAIRIEHARLNEIEEAERAMAKEMEQAAHIQMSLLPSAAPEVVGLDVAGKTVAARAVGGDYFDYIEFASGGLGVIVGDVAGKGMPASLLMSSVQARVHVLFDAADDFDKAKLSSKITTLNKNTCGSCPDNRFITFFMGLVDPKHDELTYTNAGHNPPLVLHPDGSFDRLEAGGMFLGMLKVAPYQQDTVKFAKGDILVAFSDGVTEAADPDDDDYGDERLAELVKSMKDSPAEEIVETIHTSVHEFTQGAPPADDITVVVVKRI